MLEVERTEGRLHSQSPLDVVPQCSTLVCPAAIQKDLTVSSGNPLDLPKIICVSICKHPQPMTDNRHPEIRGSRWLLATQVGEVNKLLIDVTLCEECNKETKIVVDDETAGDSPAGSVARLVVGCGAFQQKFDLIEIRHDEFCLSVKSVERSFSAGRSVGDLVDDRKKISDRI